MTNLAQGQFNFNFTQLVVSRKSLYLVSPLAPELFFLISAHSVYEM